MKKLFIIAAVACMAMSCCGKCGKAAQEEGTCCQKDSVECCEKKCCGHCQEADACCDSVKACCAEAAE